jgi:hypothetical protein
MRQDWLGLRAMGLGGGSVIHYIIKSPFVLV